MGAGQQSQCVHQSLCVCHSAFDAFLKLNAVLRPALAFAFEYLQCRYMGSRFTICHTIWLCCCKSSAGRQPCQLCRHTGQQPALYLLCLQCHCYQQKELHCTSAGQCCHFAVVLCLTYIFKYKLLYLVAMFKYSDCSL